MVSGKKGVGSVIGERARVNNLFGLLFLVHTKDKMYRYINVVSLYYVALQFQLVADNCRGVLFCLRWGV